MSIIIDVTLFYFYNFIKSSYSETDLYEKYK